jgi:O-antigen/teichoic acid export membrane protein
MATSAMMALFGFFFWVVVARFYTEAEVGYSSAIISAASLIAVLSLVGLDSSLIRFLPQAEKPRQLINSSFTITTLISMAMAGIFVAGIELWSPTLNFIKGNAVFSTVFIVTTPLFALSCLVSSTFIAKRRAGFVLSANTITSLIRIPLPMIFALFFHSFGIVASWGIALGISMAFSLFLFLPMVQKHYTPVPTLNLDLIKSIWKYSGGNYLVSFLAFFPTTILPIMVVNLLGPVQNAYFYIAWMMGTLLFSIPLGVSHSLFAEGSHFHDKLKEQVAKSLKFNFLLLVPAIIFLILIGKWILLVFGQSYSLNALTLLRILAISSLPLSINYIYISILRVNYRIKELVTIWGCIALPMLITSYLVMPVSGIVGTGYAWLGIHSAAAIYSFISLKRIRPL